jgi:cytochrome c oxidase assembly factor CtaG/putative copper export protein
VTTPAPTGTPAPPAPATPAAATPPGVRPLWWVAAAGAGLVVLAVAVRLGGGIARSRITGLPDAGPVTAWGLPATAFLVEAAATLTVGLFTTAAFMLPGDGKEIGPAAYRLQRFAAWAAATWAAATLALIVFSVSDLLGRPLSGISLTVVYSYVTAVSQGQALVVEALLAFVAASVASMTVSRGWAAFGAVVAAVGVLPPAFTGHAAGAGNHQIAVTSLAMHVLAATLWIGGLVALLLVRPRRLMPSVAARYSRLALVCWVAVAISGVANAWVRLGSWGQLWHSAYGVLVLGKLLALVALGGAGAAHRRRTLVRLKAGEPRAFLRLAAGEVVLFAATLGLAVALSRTATPVPTNPSAFDPYTDLVGFSMPPPLRPGTLIGLVLPDLFFLTVVALGLGLYLAGVRRLRRRGHPWPLGRTVSWAAGMLILGAVTNLGVSRYSYVLFSVHMAQHMLLTMVVPVLLVSGAPVTLALRALRRGPDRSVRGPREWLLIVVHSGYVRFLSHPVVALAIYVVSLYVLYFSSLLGVLMRYHIGHLFMVTHFVASGALMFWVLIGIDPGRRRLAPPILILVHFTSMVFHAFFGVALLQSQRLIAPGWFGPLHPTWAATLLSDQRLGAGIAWAFGELPAAIVMAILVRQWIRADEREQQRVDRAADRAKAAGDEDELDRYNEFLRQANAAAAGNAANTGTRTG